MTGLPDPSAAHALVIGTSEYSDDRYPEMPAATASARRMCALLRAGRIWGMPANNVQYLSSVTAREAAEAIEAKAMIPGLGALVVYICGHGEVRAAPGRQLDFALTDSRPGWDFTHLSLDLIQAMLGAAPAADRLLIADAGRPAVSREAGALAAGPPPAGSRAPVPEAPGLCVIAADPRWPADPTGDGTGCTAFSGALIDILGQGIRGPDRFLTPDLVFRELWWRLADAGQPEPFLQTGGTRLLLGRNPGYDPAPHPLSYAALVLALEQQRSPGPLAATPAAYAQAVTQCRSAGRDAAAIELIAKFCAVALVADVAGLAGQLSCADLACDADHVVTAFAGCRPPAEIADLVHRLHRLADLSIDGLLRALAQRAARDLAALVTALRTRSCGDCAATATGISDRILRVWPRAKHAELLVAWR
jgi:hypothetical protein